MDWLAILALIIIIPVLAFPALFIWYLNTGGIVALIRRARNKATAEDTVVETVEAEEIAAEV